MDHGDGRQDFGQTYQAYRSLMYYVAYHILQNEDDAEDAVAESFYKIYKNYSCLNAPVCPQTKRFVIVVTERTALNLLRARKRFADQPFEALEQTVGTAGLPEEALHIRLCLQKLPPDTRTAIMLSAACGLTAKEIAGVLDFSESKVKKLISRGKKKLKQFLKVGK